MKRKDNYKLNWKQKNKGFWLIYQLKNENIQKTNQNLAKKNKNK